MNNSESVILSQDRREFLKTALAAGTVICIGGLFGSSFAGCGSGNSTDNPTSSLPEVSPVIDLASEPALQTIGGSVKKHLTGLNNGNDIIIVRESSTAFAAFTAICTHQGAEINLPGSAGANMVCPRHGSQFRSTDGSVAQGPASLPLAKFSTAYDAQKNTVTIS
ncbi:MAG TPA: Rieske (2Fe-2S) protein [Bacteroidota bacterium]|nr:Rieske (2Fe-2S) protein [Bacteroidota bacterium]